MKSSLRSSPQNKSFEKMVCKKAFYFLYGVRKRRIEGAVEYLQESIPILKNNRGKHDQKIPDHIITKINEYIQSMYVPSHVSHLNRNKTENERFLSLDLSFRKL